MCRGEGGLLDTSVDTSNRVRAVKYQGKAKQARSAHFYFAIESHQAHVRRHT